MFTGREWIAEVGLYDYRNRVYSVELGRFLQTDPIRFDAGDVNIYRYVGNGVTRLKDPYGLEQWCESAPDWVNDLLDKIWDFLKATNPQPIPLDTTRLPEKILPVLHTLSQRNQAYDNAMKNLEGVYSGDTGRNVDQEAQPGIK